MTPLNESTIQKTIIQYLSMISRQKGFIFFSVPNEALMMALKRFKVPSKIRYTIVNFFKQMGLLPGVSDIIIGWNGLMFCMEVKDHKGKQSKGQILFEDNALKCGIPYKLVRSVDDVIRVLKEWGIM